jgi:hypothetical protein
MLNNIDLPKSLMPPTGGKTEQAVKSITSTAQDSMLYGDWKALYDISSSVLRTATAIHLPLRNISGPYSKSGPSIRLISVRNKRP